MKALKFFLGCLIPLLISSSSFGELVVLTTGGYLIGEVEEEESVIRVTSHERDSLITINKEDVAYIDESEDINSYLKSLKKDKESVYPVFEKRRPVLVTRSRSELSQVERGAIPKGAVLREDEVVKKDAFASLKDLIRYAKHEVLCVVYNIEDPRIFGLLADAKMRKIALYISASEKGVGANLLQIKNLGAEIRLMDAKQKTFSPFFIIDRRFLWLCPYGVGETHMLMPESSALIISYPPLVRQYLRLYHQAWTQTKDPSLNRAFGFLTKTTYLETLFTSGVLKRLNEEIEAASSEIYILTPVLKNTSFIRRLARKQKAGIRVKVVLTNKESLPRLRRLKDANGEVVVSERPYLVETTFIIIDGKSFITGSFLLDKISKDNLTQNIIFVYNNELAGSFRREAERLF